MRFSAPQNKDFCSCSLKDQGEFHPRLTPLRPLPHSPRPALSLKFTVCVFACVGCTSRVCMWTRSWKPEVSFRCCFSGLSRISRQSLIGLPLPRQLWDCQVLDSVSGRRGPSQGPYACEASAVFTDPSQQRASFIKVVLSCVSSLLSLQETDTHRPLLGP